MPIHEQTNIPLRQAPTQVVEDEKKVKTKLVIDFTQGIEETFCLSPYICLFVCLFAIRSLSPILERDWMAYGWHMETKAPYPDLVSLG